MYALLCELLIHHSQKRKHDDTELLSSSHLISVPVEKETYKIMQLRKKITQRQSITYIQIVSRITNFDSF